MFQETYNNFIGLRFFTILTNLILLKRNVPVKMKMQHFEREIRSNCLDKMPHF
jgi:hypothetical protein